MVREASPGFWDPRREPAEGNGVVMVDAHRFDSMGFKQEDKLRTVRRLFSCAQCRSFAVLKKNLNTSPAMLTGPAVY